MEREEARTRTRETVDAGEGPVTWEEAHPNAAPLVRRSLSTFGPDELAEEARLQAEARRTILGHIFRGVISSSSLVNHDGKVYLMGEAMMAVAEFLGWRCRNFKQWWEDHQRIDREWKGEEGKREKVAVTSTERVCVTTFELVDHRDTVICEARGGRSFDDVCKTERAVAKASEKNAWHHASVAKLGVFTFEELEAFGVKPGTNVSYDKGSRGGKHANTSKGGEACFPKFGPAAGQPIRGATMETLRYYLNALNKALEDPNNKYRASNEKTLEAIEIELGAQTPGDPPPPEQPPWVR